VAAGVGAAVRGRPEPAPQRADLHGAVDRGDEERPRARRGRGASVFADRQAERSRRLTRSLAAGGRSGLGHAGARREDPRSRHPDALLPAAEADRRHGAGRRTATADGRQRSRARRPPRRRQRPLVGQ
jgi:hypothetical protein